MILRCQQGHKQSIIMTSHASHIQQRNYFWRDFRFSYNVVGNKSICTICSWDGAVGTFLRQDWGYRDPKMLVYGVREQTVVQPLHRMPSMEKREEEIKQRTEKKKTKY